MFQLSSLTKSAIIIHSKPAYRDVFLGIDNELEEVLRQALQKNNVTVNDSINNGMASPENIIQAESLLSKIENSDNTALRCIILMLR